VQVKLQREAPVEENKLPKALSQAISTAFDLTTGPMVHATLIPLTEKAEHVLVVNMHYAVADGWSLGVLFKDISRAYNQLKQGKGEQPLLTISHMHKSYRFPKGLLHTSLLLVAWSAVQGHQQSLQPAEARQV